MCGINRLPRPTIWEYLWNMPFPLCFLYHFAAREILYRIVYNNEEKFLRERE